MDKALELLGLDDKERRFYLAAVAGGSSSVTELSTRAGVTRTHGYDLLERLASRGLLRRVAGTSGQRVVAEDPEILVAGWERTRGALDVLVSHLRSLADVPAMRPSVRLYEGRSEVDTAIAAALHPGAGRLCLFAASTGPGGPLDEPALLEHLQRMQRQKQPLRLIAPAALAPRWGALGPRQPGLHARFAPGHVALPIFLAVGEDRCSYVSSEAESYALVVRSRELALMNRTFFDCLWALMPPWGADDATSG